jgi:hypothetical protein
MRISKARTGYGKVGERAAYGSIRQSIHGDCPKGSTFRSLVIIFGFELEEGISIGIAIPEGKQVRVLRPGQGNNYCVQSDC